jgi:hypothetical protein
MTEIKQFDASQAMQSVKERIKDAFVSLIPDEQWQEMVQKEVESYFRKESEGYRTEQTSRFSKDVHSVLSEETKARVKEYIQENFRTIWNNNGIPKCNAEVERIITENAGKILGDMIGGYVQQAFSSGAYRM